jgi:predicted nucleotidyltransferase
MRPQRWNFEHSGRSSSRYVPITKDFVGQITRRIVTKCHPEKIILFGSYAYGKPEPHSDLDLLIVMNSRKSAFARHKQISSLFPQRLFALDILVKTPSEIAHRLEIQDPFFQKILARGKVLYERACSHVSAKEFWLTICVGHLNNALKNISRRF